MEIMPLLILNNYPYFVYSQQKENFEKSSNCKNDQNLRIPDVLLAHPYSTPANFEGTKPSTTPTITVKYPILGD